VIKGGKDSDALMAYLNEHLEAWQDRNAFMAQSSVDDEDTMPVVQGT